MVLLVWVYVLWVYVIWGYVIQIYFVWDNVINDLVGVSRKQKFKNPLVLQIKVCKFLYF